MPDDMMTMDGFDDCIVGVVERFGQMDIFCYDKEKVLLKLQEMGMDEEEALEFFEFNHLGAWVGEGTPCFLTWVTEGYVDKEEWIMSKLMMSKN